MPRRPSPEIRRALVERAAEMLARREPVTTRALVEGTGASTMAVYTYFGGMDGLWRAVRQEGFERLLVRLDEVEETNDAVRDLVALSSAYVGSALAHPYLYRAMFDDAADLEDPATATAGFERLIGAAARAVDDGRFDGGTDPLALATRWWAFGHGLSMLVIGGVLPRVALDEQVAPMAEAVFVAAGDRPDRCRRSIRAGWRSAGSDRPG